MILVAFIHISVSTCNLKSMTNVTMTNLHNFPFKSMTNVSMQNYDRALLVSMCCVNIISMITDSKFIYDWLAVTILINLYINSGLFLVSKHL